MKQYAMTPIPHIHRHFPARVYYAGDYHDDKTSGHEGDMRDLLLKARIRSGDYLPTLLTELETLASTLKSANVPEAAILDSITNEISFIERYYHLTKK